MKDIDMLLLQNGKVSFIGVVFSRGGKIYHYKTIEKFEKGDTVLVFAQGKYKSVEVVQVDALNISSDIDYTWIVQKIDITTYERCLEVQEQVQAILNTSRLRKLQKELAVETKELMGEENFNEAVACIDFSHD